MEREWRQLSALVVGYGSIGRRHARVLREIGLADVRVCELQADLRSQAAETFGEGRVFDTFERGLAAAPDAVFVCTPTTLHIAQAVQAVRSGMDVCVEKPLGMNRAECEELSRAVDECGAIAMPAHCFRFHEGLLRVKEWLRQGRIGRVICVRGSVGEFIPEPMPNYLDMHVSRYNGAYELMHDIDIAIWFAGQAPERVTAIDGTYSDLGMQSPDVVETLMHFPGRVLASVHLDFFQRARRRQTEVMGSEGTIIAEFARWDACNLSVYDANKRQWTHESIVTDRDDMFQHEDRAFLESVVSRKQPPVTLAEGTTAVAVVEASQTSSRTGKAVLL